MSMDVDSKVRYTTIVNKYPSNRDLALKGCRSWLLGRQKDDDAEGYWRIHDKLYNLNDFIDKHPGGKEWLEFTKGTDITEAFEAYHILPKASQVLNKFFVKNANQPRNYRLTYKTDGFYITLKSRVAKMLPHLDRTELWKSEFYLDAIVLIFFISSIMTIRAERAYTKLFFLLIASICVSWINAASHNFSHQRNNWRMYTANLVMVGWRDWKVFHCLSHHLYPNSYSDLEITAYEPHLHWIPVQKRSTLQIYYSYLITPILYPIVFHLTFFSRLIEIIVLKTQSLSYDELLILLPPVMMFLFGNTALTITNLITIIASWNIIILIGCTIYSLMAINAGHHGHKIVHEGDELKDLDFGIFQMAATIDRHEANYNLLISLTHFGDHTLHHLFPSLDHSLLPQLRDVFVETCKEFETEFKKMSMLEAVVEQFKQLSRTTTIRL